MAGPFASERARDQLARILAHVSFPGLGLILDREGCVVAAHGSAPGTTVQQVADVFGARRNAPIRAEGAVVGERYRVHRRELPAGYFLLIAVPCDVAIRDDRLDRAVELLERMLVVGALMDPGAGNSGSGAPALVGLDIERDQ